MNKVKVLYILVMVCFAVNIILLWHFMGHDSARKRLEPREVIISKLQLSEEQIAHYDKLIQQHRKAIHETERMLRESKNELYSRLGDSDTVRDSLLTIVSEFQNKIEQIHYNHFIDIKSICREDQFEKFESLKNELAALFSPPPRKEHSKP